MKKHDSNWLKNTPDFIREQELIKSGLGYIAGIDEVGRGPLAGPVVVAAVILDPKNIPEGLNDSKKLPPKKRVLLFNEIIATASFSIVSAPPHIIEKLNIRGATLWAMSEAASTLNKTPDFALIDGRDIPPSLPCPGEALTKGDSRSVTIAAASIIAKVTRDRMCTIMDGPHPEYGFARHMGYGTKFHMQALITHGATCHHRADFTPVAEALTRAKTSAKNFRTPNNTHGKF